MVRGLRVFGFCLLAFAHLATAATLTTAVDRERVGPGESFVVTFVYDGEDANPDFTPFERDFEIFHQGQSRNFRISGNDVRVETTWNLVLRPRKQGELSLPRIRFGDELSESRAILVAEAPAGAGDAPDDPGVDDLFVEVEVDKRAPYVQEQVLYTARVFRAVPIENATLTKPEMSGGDAVVDRLGEDRRYQTERDGRRYMVTERRFVVFPQTSGALTIEPVRLDAEVPVPAGDGGTSDFLRLPITRTVRADSEPVALDVKAPPADAPRPWLPARSVTLEEEWPDPDTVRAGTPITRRITLRAEGLMDSQLPELSVPLPEGVKSYPERPARETLAGDGGVNGRLEQTLAIVPAEAGTLTLPAVSVDWWNTETDSRETLRLPPRTLVVEAAPAPGPVESGTDPGGATRFPGADWWQGLLSLGLGLAWLATLVLWRRDRRREKLAAAGGRAMPVSRRAAEARLRSACRAGDPVAARDALLAWGGAIRPGRPPRSLGTLAGMTDATLAGEIAALERALYAPHDVAWRGDGLYRAVTALDTPAPANDRPASVLRPL